MAEKAPAYQWYPKDFKSDEKCQLMNFEQQGVYRALLDHQWLHGSIPNDVEDIAELLKIPLKDFQKVWRRVSPCFQEVDGRLVNPRMEKDRAQLTAFKAERKEAGAKGAAKRWQTDSSAIQPATEQPIADDSSASASASASAFTKNTDTQRNTNESSRARRAPTLDEWLEYACAQGMQRVDAESAWHHYESVSWMRNKTPITKWKSCVSTCMRRNRGSPSRPPQSPRQGISQSTIEEANRLREQGGLYAS